MTEGERIKIPEKGIVGLKNLVSLGPVKIRELCEIVKTLPLTLSTHSLNLRLADALEVDKGIVSQFVTEALMPLNHLRVFLRLETPHFITLITRTLEETSSNNWDKENYNHWKRIEKDLQPLFEKDNLFSVINKSYQMLINRPNPIQDFKILSEIRPVYSEDATTVKALVLAKTLVVTYTEGETKHTFHFSLDLDDLRSLSSEVDRAKLKQETLSNTVTDWGVELLTFGQDGV